MFDTISGLPVHPLVVHGVVVLLPLMSVVSVVVAAWAPWRHLARWVIPANFVVFLLAFAAKESGEKLQGRLGGEIAAEHAEYGDVLPLFALALLVASVVVWYATTRGGVLMTVSVVLVTVAALAATGWTVVTGDTGARAVWESVIANTQPASDD